MSTSHHIYKHRIVTHQEIIYIFHTCLVWFMMKHWSIYYTLEIPFFTVFFFYFHGLHTEMEKKNHQVNYDFINLHFFFHTCHVTNAVKNLVNCIFLSLIIRIYTGEISNSLYNKKKKKNQTIYHELVGIISTKISLYRNKKRCYTIHRWFVRMNINKCKL